MIRAPRSPALARRAITARGTPCRSPHRTRRRTPRAPAMPTTPPPPTLTLPRDVLPPPQPRRARQARELQQSPTRSAQGPSCLPSLNPPSPVSRRPRRGGGRQRALLSPGTLASSPGEPSTWLLGLEVVGCIGSFGPGRALQRTSGGLLGVLVGGQRLHVLRHLSRPAWHRVIWFLQAARLLGHWAAYSPSTASSSGPPVPARSAGFTVPSASSSMLRLPKPSEVAPDSLTSSSEVEVLRLGCSDIGGRLSCLDAPAD